MTSLEGGAGWGNASSFNPFHHSSTQPSLQLEKRQHSTSILAHDLLPRFESQRMLGGTGQRSCPVWAMARPKQRLKNPGEVPQAWRLRHITQRYALGTAMECCCVVAARLFPAQKVGNNRRDCHHTLLAAPGPSSPVKYEPHLCSGGIGST